MKKLSVLVPYRSRIDALRALSLNLPQGDRVAMEFLLLSLGDADPAAKSIALECGMQYHHINYKGDFSIGLALNYGAFRAAGEYILKQDVDCLPYRGFYDLLLEYVEKDLNSKGEWANLGVYYCTKEFSARHLTGAVTQEVFRLAQSCADNRCHPKQACGNCFLVNREHYIGVGGISPKFRGWGWEDYQVLYSLEKTINSDLTPKDISIHNVVDYCREQIARPKNTATNSRDLIFLHRWHEQSTTGNYMAYVERNRKYLLDHVNSFCPTHPPTFICECSG